MAEFSMDLQNLKPSYSGMNSNLHDADNQRALENFSSTNQEFLASFNSSFSNHQQQPQPPLNFTNNMQGFVDFSSPAISGTGLSRNIKSFDGRKRKRKRKDEQDGGKPKEVIHVRAKRGQATDSHSLAERLRREKINEKLRCLQDLVPGCYKTMGMAVMLDVIINYVQSLQNQIEFLSMKLSAASMYYDFNLERDTMETIKGRIAYEVQETEKMGKEGYGGPSCFQSMWAL